jgi:hypothetical protein
MSKLIRLTSNNIDGTIDNDFHEDILLKAGCKIALKNISLTLKTDDLKINNSNDDISFTTDSNGSTHNNYLFNDTVHPTEYDNFLHKIDDAVNIKMQALNDNNDFNTQFETSINSENKIVFGFYKSVLFDFVPSLSKNSINILINELSGSDIVISNVSTASETQENQVLFSDEFIRGSGVFRCKIKDFVDNTSGLVDNGFSIGLSERSPNKLTGKKLWTNSERTYEIQFNRLSETYKYLNRRLDDDTDPMSDSMISPLKVVDATNDDNDILEIMLSQGEIIGSVYINNVRNIIFRDVFYGDPSIDDENRNGNEAFHKLHPYIIMNGTDTDIKINCIQHSFDEVRMQDYEEIKYPSILPKMITTQTIVPFPKSLINYNVEAEFNFSNVSIMKWLGFSSLEIKGTTNKNKHTLITANTVFEPVVYSKSIVVELQNISLNSFDSIKKGRLNILEVVPDEQDITISNNVITYEPNQLNFIQMSNISDILQRSFRVRLLNKFLNPIKTRGLIVLTILIQD